MLAGHASSQSNANSSRFGKHAQLFFDGDGHLCGARHTVYQLERARVAWSREDERNFHVFYGMTDPQVRASVEEVALLQLGEAEDYDFLAHDGCMSGAHDDAQAFQHMYAALSTLGPSPPFLPARGSSVASPPQCLLERASGIRSAALHSAVLVRLPFSSETRHRAASFSFLFFSCAGLTQVQRKCCIDVLGAVLHLGNVSVSAHSDSGVERCVVEPTPAARQAAHLLGCDPGELFTAMCQRKVTVGAEEARRPLLLSRPDRSLPVAQHALAPGAPRVSGRSRRLRSCVRVFTAPCHACTQCARRARLPHLAAPCDCNASCNRGGYTHCSHLKSPATLAQAVVPLTPPEALAARDALAKGVYGALFKWLVERVNHGLAPPEGALPVDGTDLPSVGLLDMQGFESTEGPSCLGLSCLVLDTCPRLLPRCRRLQTEARRVTLSETGPRARALFVWRAHSSHTYICVARARRPERGGRQRAERLPPAADELRLREAAAGVPAGHVRGRATPLKGPGGFAAEANGLNTRF